MTKQKRRDRPVSMAELQRIWPSLRERGICYNGCTNAELRAKYGDRVYHAPGEGWYVRPAAE